MLRDRDAPVEQGTPTVHMTRAASGHITSVGEGIVDILGWRPQDMVGHPSTKFVHPDDQGSAIAVWMEMLASPGKPFSWRGRYHAAGGRWVWVETVNTVSAADPQTVSTLMRTVTADEVDLEEDLRAREQLLSRLSDALPVGVFQIQADGRIAFSNDRLHKVLGTGETATIEAQLAAVVEGDLPAVRAAISAVLAGRDVEDTEFRVGLAGEGTDAAGERVCLLGLRSLTGPEGNVTGAVGCVSDVTDSVQLRHQLETKASVDDLTSCLNRAAITDLLERVATAEGPGERGTALVFLDVDNLKQVNDQYGHAAGDAMLVEFADRLRAATRGGDRVGRLGGDEFVVVCPRVESGDQALKIAQRISDFVKGTVSVAGGSFPLSASAGVAWTATRLDVGTLLARADEAMYESKRAGRGGVTFIPA